MKVEEMKVREVVERKIFDGTGKKAIVNKRLNVYFKKWECWKNLCYTSYM